MIIETNKIVLGGSIVMTSIGMLKIYEAIRIQKSLPK